MSFDLAPWHMWGSQATFTASSGETPQTQLIRISYKRPESWKFFLFARPESYPANEIRASFYLATGIGRGFADLTTNSLPFCTMVWTAPVKGPKFCTQVRSSIIDENNPNSFTLCDSIVGEDIQLAATLTVVGAPAQTVMTIGAFMAPIQHVRPEWWMEKFQGGELFGK